MLGGQTRKPLSATRKETRDTVVGPRTRQPAPADRSLSSGRCEWVAVTRAERAPRLAFEPGIPLSVCPARAEAPGGGVSPGPGPSLPGGALLPGGAAPPLEPRPARVRRRYPCPPPPTHTPPSPRKQPASAPETDGSLEVVLVFLRLPLDSGLRPFPRAHSLRPMPPTCPQVPMLPTPSEMAFRFTLASAGSPSHPRAQGSLGASRLRTALELCLNSVDPAHHGLRPSDSVSGGSISWCNLNLRGDS